MAEPDVLAGREAVAAEIRALLARRKVRHAELAKALGISAPAMSRRLTGEHPFDVDELQIVAGFFGIEVVTLVSTVSPRHGEWSPHPGRQAPGVTDGEWYVPWLTWPEPVAA